jgi:ADP-dependent phosphofructokinase/glucokinase
MNIKNIKKVNLSKIDRASIIEKHLLDGYEDINIEMHRGETRRNMIKNVFSEMSGREKKEYLKTHIHPEKLEDTDLYY